MARAAAEAAAEAAATWASTAANTRSRRFGARRNLHLARFGDFEHLRPCAPVDLLVCSDVLHYLDTRELDRGLPALAELCGGVAFLETFTREDGIDGDTHGFKRRPAKFYRQRFDALGLAAARLAPVAVAGPARRPGRAGNPL